MLRIHPNRLGMMLVIPVLLVPLLSGCQAASDEGEAPAGDTAAVERTAAPPTEAQTSEPAVESSGGTPRLEAKDVSFEFDESLATGVAGRIVPASGGSSDVPPWETYPEHVAVAFEGYMLADTFHEPQLLVYPVAEYSALSEPIGGMIGFLEQLLTVQPDSLPDTLPFLPPFNAGQMFTAQLKTVRFQGGSGLRYVTQYSQAIVPVNNHEVFYTFQGLTVDGAYYVAAVFPVSAPILPDTAEVTGDYDAFIAGFEDELEETVSALNEMPVSDFTPDLALLDALIESLTVSTS